MSRLLLGALSCLALACATEELQPSAETPFTLTTLDEAEFSETAGEDWENVAPGVWELAGEDSDLTVTFGLEGAEWELQVALADLESLSEQ